MPEKSDGGGREGDKGRRFLGRGPNLHTNRGAEGGASGRAGRAHCLLYASAERPWHRTHALAHFLFPGVCFLLLQEDAREASLTGKI